MKLATPAAGSRWPIYALLLMANLGPCDSGDRVLRRLSFPDRGEGSLTFGLTLPMISLLFLVAAWPIVLWIAVTSS